MPGQAQTRPDPELEVTGQKMPRAEAPRVATCEALARDPDFRALLAAGGDPLMGPRVSVPAGSALPRLGGLLGFIDAGPRPSPSYRLCSVRYRYASSAASGRA